MTTTARLNPVMLTVAAVAGALVAGYGSNPGSAAARPTAAESPAAAPEMVASAGLTETPECKAADLRLSLGDFVDGAAGHSIQALQFTNVGRSTCTMVGFPGVSYVAGDNGQEVGDPAVREGPPGRPINLAPGRMAATLIAMTQPDLYDPNACRPALVYGFRVYPPDDTTAMYIARPGTTGCAADPGAPMLMVRTVEPGSGND